MRIVSAVAVKVIHKLRFDFYYIRTYVLFQVSIYRKYYFTRRGHHEIWIAQN
nr:MAG TPA: hypothetical protein [Caudoviricetes sp.]